jgi:hypothetical protein
MFGKLALRRANSPDDLESIRPVQKNLCLEHKDSGKREKERMAGETTPTGRSIF